MDAMPMPAGSNWKDWADSSRSHRPAGSRVVEVCQCRKNSIGAILMGRGRRSWPYPNLMTKTRADTRRFARPGRSIVCCRTAASPGIFRHTYSFKGRDSFLMRLDFRGQATGPRPSKDSDPRRESPSHTPRLASDYSVHRKLRPVSPRRGLVDRDR
jgi:hypothetical protein